MAPTCPDRVDSSVSCRRLRTLGIHENRIASRNLQSFSNCKSRYFSSSIVLQHSNKEMAAPNLYWLVNDSSGTSIRNYLLTITVDMHITATEILNTQQCKNSQHNDMWILLQNPLFLLAIQYKKTQEQSPQLSVDRCMPVDVCNNNSRPFYKLQTFFAALLPCYKSNYYQVLTETIWKVISQQNKQNNEERKKLASLTYLLGRRSMGIQNA